MRPRVALVLSSLARLPEPLPPEAQPGGRQIEAMVRAALELAGAPACGRGDRVIVKPNIVCCPGLSPGYGPGGVTDLRIVRSLVEWLAGKGCRVTIAEGAGGWGPAPLDGWTTCWDGAFAGLSYQSIARECGAGLLDLNFAPTVEYRRSGRVYALPRAVAECDALLSLSPLKTNKGAGVSLSMKNYFGIAPGSVYGCPKFGLHAMGPLAELIADLYSFRPDGYALLGGPLGVEGDGDAEVRHHVLIAGSSCVAADVVAAAVMGFEARELEFLRVARERGLGATDLGAIEVRGNRVEEARRPFRRPAGWAPHGS